MGLLAGLMFSSTQVEAAAKNVTTFGEFKQALLDQGTDEINVTAPISLTENVENIPNRSLKIKGAAGATLKSNTYGLVGATNQTANSVLTLENLAIEGSKTAGTFFVSGTDAKNRKGWDLSIKNLTYSGMRLADIRDGSFSTDAKNTITTTLENVILGNLTINGERANNSFTSGVDNALIDTTTDISTFYFKANDMTGMGKANIASNTTIKNYHNSRAKVQVPPFYNKMIEFKLTNSANLDIISDGIDFGTKVDAEDAKFVQKVDFLLRNASFDFQRTTEGLAADFVIPTTMTIDGTNGNWSGTNGNNAEGIITSDDLSINFINWPTFGIWNKNPKGIILTGNVMIDWLSSDGSLYYAVMLDFFNPATNKLETIAFDDFLQEERQLAIRKSRIYLDNFSTYYEFGYGNANFLGTGGAS